MRVENEGTFRAHLQATSLRALSPLGVCERVRVLHRGIELETGAHSHQQGTVTASGAGDMLENHSDHAPPASAPRLTPVRERWKFHSH